ncbi:hypothetical protein MRX96_018662 [Rhipicephalus microplus]
MVLRRVSSAQPSAGPGVFLPSRPPTEATGTALQSSSKTSESLEQSTECSRNLASRGNSLGALLKSQGARCSTEKELSSKT